MYTVYWFINIARVHMVPYLDKKAVELLVTVWHEIPWLDLHRTLTHSWSCDVNWCERHIVPKATMTTVGYLGSLLMGVLTLPCPSARLMCWHLLRPLLCSRLPSRSFAWPHFSSNTLFGCQSSNLRPGHTLLLERIFFFFLPSARSARCPLGGFSRWLFPGWWKLTT